MHYVVKIIDELGRTYELTSEQSDTLFSIVEKDARFIGDALGQGWSNSIDSLGEDMDDSPYGHSEGIHVRALNLMMAFLGVESVRYEFVDALQTALHEAKEKKEEQDATKKEQKV